MYRKPNATSNITAAVLVAAGMIGSAGCARLPVQRHGPTEMTPTAPPPTPHSASVVHRPGPSPRRATAEASPTARTADHTTTPGGPAETSPLPRTADATAAGAGSVRIVEFTDTMAHDVARAHPHLGPMLDAARGWLGTPYVWGGARKGPPARTHTDANPRNATQTSEAGSADSGGGVDCSYFTWLLARECGMQYARYMSTRVLARHRGGAGLQPLTDGQIPRPGDLLVYGYYDQPTEKRGWHGHVVILIDPDGQVTGVPGLVLGAHGGNVRQVAYVQSTGYDQQFFREPKHQLRAVLRPTEFQIQPHP